MWLLISVALAGPLGQPYPDPDVERVSLTALASSTSAETQAKGCTAQAGCDALWEARSWTAQGSVAIVRGVGVYGELGRVTEVVKAAEYDGAGTGWAAGLRLALPVTRTLGVAADLRYAGVETVADPVEGALGGPGDASRRGSQLSLMGTLGSPASGGLGWLGVQTSPGWTDSLRPLGSVDGEPLTEVELQPSLPVSVIFGMAGVSEELGLPWRSSAHVSAGAEGWVGQSSGLSVWLGIGF
jgi:hypothetical protein